MKKRLLPVMLCLLLAALAACTPPQKTVAQYVAEHREMFAEMEGEVPEGIELTVEPRGDSLVYSYRYTAGQTPQELERFRSAMEQAAVRQEQSALLVLAALRKEVPDAVSVIFEYRAADGQVIFSKEFRGEQ